MRGSMPSDRLPLGGIPFPEHQSEAVQRPHDEEIGGREDSGEAEREGRGAGARLTSQYEAVQGGSSPSADHKASGRDSEDELSEPSSSPAPRRPRPWDV